MDLTIFTSMDYIWNYVYDFWSDQQVLKEIHRRVFE